MKLFSRLLGRESAEQPDPFADPQTTRILFVCMGNICRSPTAEGVFRQMAELSDLKHAVHIDSAGTHEYHAGSPPDRRAVAVAAMRGYDLTNQRARCVSVDDFARFDMILAMDRANLTHLREQCPEPLRDKLRLFMEFSEAYADHEVPDPYYGGPRGFEEVLDRIEDAARGLLDHLRVQRLLA